MWASLSTRVALSRALERGPLRLNLGCGRHLLPGWINTDLRPVGGALYLDARRPLPLPDSCCHFVFSEHFLEHLSAGEGLTLLRECRRVLSPDGALRISTPDLSRVVATYLDTNPDVTRPQALERHARLVGEEAVSPARFLNDKMRHWGHQYLYDRPELEAALRRAGFTRIDEATFGVSRHPELCGLERHADTPWMCIAEPLILEAAGGGAPPQHPARAQAR